MAEGFEESFIREKLDKIGLRVRYEKGRRSHSPVSGMRRLTGGLTDHRNSESGFLYMGGLTSPLLFIFTDIRLSTVNLLF